MAELSRAAIDGGSRGNPGLAACGVAILDADGECAEGHAGVLGHATNNVAEYHGLRHPVLKPLYERAMDESRTPG